jgi:hydrogenase nickel incorporation protein HypA/HybF
MHEFPEVQAMVKAACAQIGPGASIGRLKIVVGEASGHDPGHIAAHFAEASRNTPAEGAELEFQWEKLAARCAACGAAFGPGERALACPQCGGVELVITAGNSVRLVEVVARSQGQGFRSQKRPGS